MSGWSSFGRRLVQLPGLSALNTLLVAAGVIREKLTANRTYYVRTDGSDSNTGLVDSAGGAFLTLQKAFNVIQSSLDVAGFTVGIQKGSGTHTAGITIGAWVGGGTITLDGGGGTISTTNANCIATTGTLGGPFTYQNVTLQTTTSGSCVVHNAGGTVTQGASVVFAASAATHILLSAPGAFWQSTSSYSITGAAVRHYWIAAPGAQLIYQVGTVTLTGTPAITLFIEGTRLSWSFFSGTYSGSATGTRYSVTQGAIVQTNGAGATYFPGSVGGSVATGGQYL